MAALHAAWKRDHQVARRRLWWRWTAWIARRYLIPAAVGVGLFAGLWFAAKATMTGPKPPTIAEPAVVSVPATTLRLPQARINQLPTAANSQNQSNEPFPPLPNVDSNGMALAFEAGLPGSETAPSTHFPDSAATSPEDAKNPHLISENWLHSKEP